MGQSPWDILEVTWFWVKRSKVNVRVRVSRLWLTAIRSGFELYECLLIDCYDCFILWSFSLRYRTLQYDSIDGATLKGKA